MNKYLLTWVDWNKKKVNDKPIWPRIKVRDIHPPRDLEKCVNIFLKHLKTKILLLLIKSKTSPKADSARGLSFIILLFDKSLNKQSHVEVISSKLIPLISHPSSHNSTSGYKIWILELRGISFFIGLSKS